MASRTKRVDPDAFKRASKVDPKRKKANANRRFDEHVLSTIDGASRSVPLGSVVPTLSEYTNRETIYQVVRVDESLDAVYGVVVERLPMPWYKWNRMLAQGLVDEDALKEFNRKTSD